MQCASSVHGFNSTLAAVRSGVGNSRDGTALPVPNREEFAQRFGRSASCTNPRSAYLQLRLNHRCFVQACVFDTCKPGCPGALWRNLSQGCRAASAILH